MLTRQGLPHQPRTSMQVEAIRRGGYVLADCEGVPDCILIASGSEVALAVEASRLLAAEGRKVRVVSMPCTSAFEQQDAGYRERVLPREVTARVAVEAGVGDGWWRYVGEGGAVVGMSSFGASAPAKELFRHFGFTPEAVAAAARGVIAR